MKIAIRIAIVTSVLLAQGVAAQDTAAGDRAETARLESRPAQAVADSVVLERTACYGTCPAYRVSITHAGDVHFVSQNSGEAPWGGEGHVDSSQFRSLVVVATVWGRFPALPESIEGEPKYCPRKLTDQPTAIVTIYYQHQTKSVVDYHGCAWAPVSLRRLEDAIDSTAGSKQWVRPYTRK